MHPLSIFPRLLDYGLLAPTLIRVAVVAYFLFVAWIKFAKVKSSSAIIFAILGILLGIGLYTQPVALIAILVLIFDLYQNAKKYGVNLEQRMIFTFVVLMLLSLLLTGPGFFALDLPL